jgi:hypothetical protein
MSQGSARLGHCLKSLRESWESAKERWSDSVSRDFEKNHLNPLEQNASTAVHGMDKLSEILRKIRQDCA